MLDKLLPPHWLWCHDCGAQGPGIDSIMNDRACGNLLQETRNLSGFFWALCTLNTLRRSESSSVACYLIEINDEAWNQECQR